MSPSVSTIVGNSAGSPIVVNIDPAQPGPGLPAGGGAGPEAPDGVNSHRVVSIKGWTFQGRSADDVDNKESSLYPSTPVDLEIPNRTKNLLWIKSNTFYREALDDCKELKRKYSAKIDESQRRAGEVTNQIYNLIGFFSVFQGVILTAVTQLTQSTQSSQPPRPLCGKVWFPAVLSGLAAIATVIGISLKYNDLLKAKVKIISYTRKEWDVEKRESKLIQEGEHFLFKNVRKKPESRDTGHLLLISLAVIAGVIVFTAVLIMSYVVIMCDKLVADWH